MRFIKILIALVILAAIVGGIVLWTLPADVAYRHGARYLGPVVLSGIRGTLWDGHADGVSLFGRDLGEIDWNVAKAPMLRGRLVANVRVQGADVDAAGDIERASGGDIALHDVRFRFPASLLANVVEAPDLTLLGTVSGLVADATLRDGFVRSATGNARWSEAGVSGAADARFADIVGDFAGQPDGGIAGTAHDDGTGNLAVASTFHANIAGFEADAVLSARNGDAAVLETLRHVGEPQADGSSKLVVRGRMFKLY